MPMWPVLSRNPHRQATVFLQPCRHLKEVAVGNQRVTICPERSSESRGAFRRMLEDGRYASDERQNSIGLERGRPLRMETNMPILRVSVLRCQPQHFAELKKMMAESLGALEHGIRQMRGLIHFYAGEDEAVNSLTNVSVWRTLEDAKQLDTFQP